MPQPLRITSSANPRVKDVVRLREQRHRRRTGLFIAEGQREVTRAAAAGLRLRELFTCPDLLAADPAAARTAERLSAELPPEVARMETAAAVFRKMAYLREPEGLLAVVEQPRWTLDALPPADARTLYLVAVGIEKPGNLGAMVRTADAAGCGAVLAAGSAVDAFNPNAIRTSTAAVFSVPTVADDEAVVLDYLLGLGVRIAAATPAGAVAHTAANLASGPLAIAIGAEDVGLSAAWLDAASRSGGQRVVIPMHSRTVDSLNASTAAAVLLFEALRQRQG